MSVYCKSRLIFVNKSMPMANIVMLLVQIIRGTFNAFADVTKEL